MDALKNKFQKNGWQIWLGVLLVAFAGFAWVQVLLARQVPYVVDAIVDPQVTTLLDYIRSGDHSGETWEITLTELQAEQTITWYLQRYPQIPFAHPNVTMKPDYLMGEGDVMLSGLRIHVSGKVSITLQDGLPVVKILALNLPLPPNIRNAVEQEIQVQLQRAELLPVRFSTAEWNDGVVTVRGTIR